MVKRSNRKWVLVMLVLVMSAVACTCGLPFNLPFIGSGAATEPLVDDLEDLQAALAAEKEDDRPEVVEYLGRPDAFDIAFVEVEGGYVRMESWRYYQFGLQVDFVDGEAVWMIELEPMPEETFFAAWYDPMEFVLGMTGSEVARLVAASSPAGEEPQWIDLAEGGDDLMGGTALIGDQIVIGLDQDRLVYVETIALLPAGGE